MRGLVPDQIVQRIKKADLSPNYYHGLAGHGPRLLDEAIRPATIRLAKYFDIDRLQPRLEACSLSPEENKDTALLFFTDLCVSARLVNFELKWTRSKGVTGVPGKAMRARRMLSA